MNDIYLENMRWSMEWYIDDHVGLPSASLNINVKPLFSNNSILKIQPKHVLLASYTQQSMDDIEHPFVLDKCALVNLNW